MTYHVFEDGPFQRPTDDGWEDYRQRRWVIRCNGDMALEDYFHPLECHVVSDGEWKRTPAVQLRQAAAKEGWIFGTYDGRVCDLCPACAIRAERLLRLAESVS